jgi:hypothetical protein
MEMVGKPHPGHRQPGKGGIVAIGLFQCDQ